MLVSGSYIRTVSLEFGHLEFINVYNKNPNASVKFLATDGAKVREPAF